MSTQKSEKQKDLSTEKRENAREQRNGMRCVQFAWREARVGEVQRLSPRVALRELRDALKESLCAFVFGMTLRNLVCRGLSRMRSSRRLNSSAASASATRIRAHDYCRLRESKPSKRVQGFEIQNRISPVMMAPVDMLGNETVM